MKFNDIIKVYIKKKWPLLLVFLLVTCIPLPLESIGFSNLITYIINEYSKKETNFSTIYYYIIILIIIVVIIKIVSTLELYLEYSIDRDLLELIRNKMFEGVINKYKHTYSEIEIGKVLSKFSTVPEAYQELVFRFLKELLPKFISIIILNIYFYFINIKIGLTITFFLFLNIIIILLNKKECQKKTIYRLKEKHLEDEKLSDKMSNIFSILVNGNTNKEIREHEYKERKYKKLAKNSHDKNASVELYLNVLNIITFIFVLLIYNYELKNSKKKNYILIASLLIFTYIYKGLSSVTWYITNYFNLIGYIKSIDPEFIEIQKKIYLKNKKRIELKTGNIEFKNVNFYYNEKKIINNLNFKILDKKINCIIGTSGSGKSTIIKLLLGLLPLKNGTINIDNTNINDFPEFYLNSNISMVSQNIKLFNGTILNNITYGNNNIDTNKIKNYIKELNLNNTVFKKLENGIYTKVGVNGSHLSNGQQQITLILRAFLQNKNIIILDEPTTALDSETKNIILNLIQKLSHNKTIIIVTHDIEVKNISNNIIDLNKINKIEK